MRHKLLYSLTTCAALALTMSACGSSSTANTSGTSEGGTSAATAPQAEGASDTASPSATSEGGSDSDSATGDATNSLSGSLVYAIWDAAQKPAMQTIVDNFTKQHPSVDITIEVTPGKEYFPKRQTEAASGTLPDVWWNNVSRIPLYASEGMLLPLTELADSGSIDFGNYPQPIVDSATWDGVRYGIPKDFDTIAVFYNKAIFDQAGVTYPSPDWTWDTFKQAATSISDKLKGDGIYGTVTDLSDGQGGYFNTMVQAGGYVIAPDKKSVGYNDAKSLAGLQFWADLIKAGAEPTLQQIADTADDQRFLSGKAGMWWTGSWSTASVRDAPVGATSAVVKMPKGEKSATVMSGISNVVSANTKSPDAAKAFVAYLGSQEAAMVQAETGTVIPAFNGTQQAWVDAFPAEMTVQTFVDAATDGTAFLYPVSLNTGAWMKLESDYLPDAFDGAASMDQAAKALTEAANAVLAGEGN